MNCYTTSFKRFLAAKENRIWIGVALVMGIVYFITLRFLYPIPSFYSDSFTWVGAAQTGQPVTFRPVGYSKVMMFFRFFSVSDIALIAAQHFSNLLTNLFLFFTFNFLFCIKNGFKLLLYLILILNPFYLLYSNYISSDSFFSCLAVIWFTLLIWIMYRPSWFLILAQLIVLAALFELRYNAIFFPAISTIALLLSKMPLLKKAIGIASGFLLIATIIFVTTYVTKKYTGTTTFSAFSGWQLANDGLHVMQHSNIDTNKIKNKEVKAFARYAIHFFDTARQTFPDSAASAVFMWHIHSPLKRYMTVYPKRSKSYFVTWNRLGPVYNKFGKTVILQKPFTYILHFVVPNLKAYFFPPLEIYETYMENSDTIGAAATRYYQYKNNRTPVHHPTVYSFVFPPMQYLFTGVNIIFVLAGLYFLFFGRYRERSKLFNHTLLCFTAFYLANLFFIVLLAPSVFRYHIFILTLSFPILIYMIQQALTPAISQQVEGVEPSPLRERAG